MRTSPLQVRAPDQHGCDVHARCSTKHDDHHHNPPKSWWDAAGKRFRGTIYRLCPNAHAGEVHEAIDELVLHGHLLRRYSSKVRAIAYEAIELARRYGLTPARTL